MITVRLLDLDFLIEICSCSVCPGWGHVNYVVQDGAMSTKWSRMGDVH